MVKTKTELTNYNFFEQTFDSAVPDRSLAERIKNKYFNTDQALVNATEEIGKN